MKGILIGLCAIIAVSRAAVVITAEGQDTPHLLGDKACTWGPTYWCQNLTTASGCRATKHCIKHFWEKMDVPEDNDSVCNICKDMVQQARDQLESNQTQEDLKAVFEGSCILIHVKPVVKECIKLVDQFVPELIETLASQMNPSVVCSVAGLCNSARIDAMLLEYQKKPVEADLEHDELEPDECSKCYTIATYMENKLNESYNSDLMERALEMCGYMSSFSDACSSIVIAYSNEICEHVRQNFKAENICHLSGQCSGRFHKHEDQKAPKVEIRPLSSVGMVEISDDLPCKLCEQLVGHLRDLLVANTTELEFQQVLEGMCRQTKSFAVECKAIVDEYYSEIYEFLTKRLDGNFLCEMANICPAPGKAVFNGPIRPLVPTKAVQMGAQLFAKKKEAPKSEADEMQLPIERFNVPLLSFPRMDVEGKATCALCTYILHYIQNVITDPMTDTKVKQVLDKVCQKLPETVENDCTMFVNTYGDAIVALLAEEIDPSQVCPKLAVCMSQQMLDAWQQIPRDWMIEHQVEKNKPSCPLCLLAISQLYEAIKNNKTEQAIEAELNKLCSHLPKDLSEECSDLVKGYSSEIIKLLLADLTPQEICVYIKFCNPQKKISAEDFFPMDKDGEIMTNEIPDFPLHSVAKPKESSACAICKLAMGYVENEMRDNRTRDEIEHIVHSVCNHLPKKMSSECNNFVTEYADLVTELLAHDLSPAEVCAVIGICKSDSRQMQRLRDSVAECALCRAVMSGLQEILADPQVDQNFEEAVAKVCEFVPASKQNRCTLMMEVYAQSIINLLEQHVDPAKICGKLALCSSSDYFILMSTEKGRPAYGGYKIPGTP